MRLDEKAGNGDNNSYDDRRTLAEFTVPSEPGNERLAMEQVSVAVQPLNLPKKRLEELKTAVAEATMNAMERSFPPAG